MSRRKNHNSYSRPPVPRPAPARAVGENEPLAVTLDSGLTLYLEADALDDWELLDALRQIESNPMAIMDAFTMLLGSHQLDMLKESIRTESGRVKMTDMTMAFGEIMAKVNTLKK